MAVSWSLTDTAQFDPGRCAAFLRAYQEIDALITPTSPIPAFRLGEKSDPLAMYLCDIYTIPTNLAGHPAMSVPFGNGAHGMPIGIQVLAPALGEQAMFRVGGALETARAGK